jgi:predicted Fe-Mo cluster-binding NifX family protein
MMLVAISSQGPDLEGPVDARFGRAAGFVVIDSQTMQSNYIENGAAQAMAQGAGIQAAETVAQAGAQVVLTGIVGPKASRALKAAGIRIGINLAEGTVAEALQRFQQGDFTET